MAAPHTIQAAAAAVTVLLVMMTSMPGADAWKTQTKIEYYGTATLYCHVNVTVFPSHTVFWILPDASIVPTQAVTTTTTQQTFPKNVMLQNTTRLVISDADDDQFGYYTCVMVENAAPFTANVAVWGLNVDGADFSKLEAQYRESAVIGAVAAAVMLVLVGGACLIWHYRYSKRSGLEGRSSSLSSSSIEDDLKKKPQAHIYNNSGYDGPAVTAADIEMAETTTTNTAAEAEKTNGSTTTTTTTTTPANGTAAEDAAAVESYKM